MGQLWETDFVFSHLIGGRMRIISVDTEQAVFPRLRFLIGCVLHDLKESADGSARYDLIGLSGELRMRESNRLVGNLTRIGPEAEIQSEASRPSERSVVLACDMDLARLEAVETERNGRPPEFIVSLWPRFVGSKGFMPCSVGQIHVEIARDDWIRMLTRMRAERIEIVEIRYPPGSASEYETALGHTRAARGLLDKGYYDEAAGVCRKAIEALQVLHQIGKQDDTDWKSFFSGRVRKDIAGEYSSLVARAKQLSGFALHEFGTPPPNYSRAEAFAIVRVTENIIAIIADLSVRKAQV